MKAIVARLVNPVVWRIPGHGARKLFGFSLAEHGSMLDLHGAVQLTESASRRASYLRHMLDEARHARIFATRAAELRLAAGQPSLGFPVADTEDLFSRLGEQRFLAFVHRGETRGRQQFETYRDWFASRGDRKTSGMFAAIIKDELRHEQYTYALLVEVAGSEAKARSALRAAAMWEAWRTWRRLGRFAAEKVYFVLMLMIYCVSAPVIALSDRSKGRGIATWTEAETNPDRPETHRDESRSLPERIQGILK
jgi:hypothetical protein